METTADAITPEETSQVQAPAAKGAGRTKFRRAVVAGAVLATRLAIVPSPEGMVVAALYQGVVPDPVEIPTQPHDPKLPQRMPRQPYLPMPGPVKRRSRQSTPDLIVDPPEHPLFTALLGRQSEQAEEASASPAMRR